METPSTFQISSVNEGGRGQFQSMNEAGQTSMPLLYNTLACWPWPDLLFVVVQWLEHGGQCVKIQKLMQGGVGCYEH